MDRHNNLPHAPQAHADREAQLQEALAAALKARQFFICLQPKFSLPGRRIVGAEALLRWNDPEEGILFPAEFLPAAEHIGYLEALDLYALEEACRCVRSWAEQGIPAVPLSVNLSAETLRATGFCEAARDCLQRYDIPPAGIEFEFSAQHVRNYPAQLAKMISCLHKLDCACSIDGFSEGASVLTHLRAFEVDTVKFNCRGFAHANQQAGMAACIETLYAARELHMRMLCEGVELPCQLTALAAAGCELMQGYALSMPVSTHLFAQMLRKLG